MENLGMETLRELIATVIFITGIVLIAEVIGDFQWGSLFGSMTCFIIAYFVWPSKKRGQRAQENSFLDIIELVIEFPVEMIMWIFRFLGRIFRSKDGGFDVDIDF